MSLRSFLPRTVRGRRILSGPLRGMRIYASWHNYPRAILGIAEKRLLAWFASNVQPGDTWLDVGAHYGYTALALCNRVGATGRVFAFDPALSTAGFLSLTREANRLAQLIVVPLGLSDSPKLTRSKASPLDHGMVGIPAGQSTIPVERWGETVYLVALDRAWRVLAGENERVTGIKIDVQGLEVETLRGMTELLREQQPRLIVEYHDYADLNGVLDALAAAGYSREGFDIDLGSSTATSKLAHGHNYEFLPKPDPGLPTDRAPGS